MKISLKIITFLFIALHSYDLFSQEDAMLLIINNSKNEKPIKRKEVLRNAFNTVENTKNDTLKKLYYSKLSYEFYRIKDSVYFRKASKLGIKYAKKLKDSSLIAKHYWDLGSFHNNFQRSDSAYSYYNASKKIHQKLKNYKSVGILLLNIAKIQSNVKDYTGSEIKIIDAIKIFKKLKDYNRLYNCYNLLGIIHNNLDDYEQAIKYHNDALKYLKKANKKSLKEAISLNNIGVVYKDLEQYKKAIEKYSEALSYDSLLQKNPKQYAMLLDNLAYAKFKLKDTSNILPIYYEALSIRNRVKHSSGIIANKLHLSEYYLNKNDTLMSKKYADEATTLAKEIKSYDQLLSLYKLQSQIYSDKNSYYLNKYIKLNDSLVREERAIRNKFARIQFETDIVETENKKLNIQNNWIVAISSAIIFFGFLIYVITQQRTRNKELEMEQQQQRANEEIYNLMIDQQDKIEEGRKREKERISLELHDGVLGRLFGTRLSLGSLNAKDDPSSKKTREQYINELQSIEEEVRNISHELGLDNFDKTTSYSTMIANLLEEQSKITNFKYQIEDDDQIVWTDIPGHIKINIYRIIQESIQNINKYAQAENVILDFKKNDNHIILTIKDDGVGFDQEKRSSGIGLKNMKSRVTLLHGQFTINSIPGKGTSISVDVPMT